MILREGAMVVLDCGDGSPLDSAEIAAPACICTGLETVEVKGLMAADGCALWLVRWLCGLEIAFSARPMMKPDFLKLYESISKLGLSYRLEDMQVSNELPI